MSFHNFKRLFAAVLALVAISPALFSQTDFDVAIARHKGNKIVLLGEWKPDDIAKWNQTLGSDEIFGHGFTLLDRSKLSYSAKNLLFAVDDINAFESWFRQKYGISGADTWAALDFGNKFIVSGQQAPSPKDFDQMLERRGIKTPARQLRDFLKKNPGHLDATRDLLKEVRRRALAVMPKGVDKDLDDETDLRTWAVLASETDKAFSDGLLPGIGIDFFWVNRDQPEQYSKQMRAVFRKHISKVESAIRQNPTGFWNIWAWMARGMGDYKWDTFINSLEIFYDQVHNHIFSCPNPEVCVWLVADARAKKDWGMVAKLARIARRFTVFGKSEPESVEWTPGGNISSFGMAGSNSEIVKYPFATAFAPHLEALLRLGEIDEANAVYDEMLRWENSSNANRARLAVDAAKAAGREEIAKLWEKGELVNKVPYREMSPHGVPFFIAFTKEGSDFIARAKPSNYIKNLNEALQKLNPPNLVTYADAWRDYPALGWKKADAPKWALMRKDGVLIAQGSEIPDVGDLQRMWDSLNVVSPPEWFRTYIAQHPDQPRMALAFFYQTIGQIINSQTIGASINQSSPVVKDISKAWPWGQDWVNEYEKALGEAIRQLRRVMRDFPDDVASMPGAFYPNQAYMAKAAKWLATVDESVASDVKALSGPILATTESKMEKSPSSVSLWNNWLFWRMIEGRERPMEPLVARLRYSPLSVNSIDIPIYALDMYWEDCKKNGSWAKVVELLKGPWERELSKAMNVKNGLADGARTRYENYASAGDRIGIPLIEAYLNDDRPGDARDVFDAWLATGNTFKDISAIVSLATAKGQERLAKEWKARVKK